MEDGAPGTKTMDYGNGGVMDLNHTKHCLGVAAGVIACVIVIGIAKVIFSPVLVLFRILNINDVVDNTHDQQGSEGGIH